MDKTELHEIGLVSILLSSKYEDVIPIHMSQILKDAGHNKFTRDQILKRERDLLLALTFKIQGRNIYEESSIMIKLCLTEYKKHTLRKVNEELLFSFHMFICQIAVHSLEFAHESSETMAPAIAMYSLSYLKKVCKNRCTE